MKNERNYNEITFPLHIFFMVIQIPLQIYTKNQYLFSFIRKFRTKITAQMFFHMFLTVRHRLFWVNSINMIFIEGALSNTYINLFSNLLTYLSGNCRPWARGRNRVQAGTLFRWACLIRTRRTNDSLGCLQGT